MQKVEIKSLEIPLFSLIMGRTGLKLLIFTDWFNIYRLVASRLN